LHLHNYEQRSLDLYNTIYKNAYNYDVYSADYTAHIEKQTKRILYMQI